LKRGEWHLPFADDEIEFDLYPHGPVTPACRARVSCARCARVSYLTHDGRRDISADLDLADKLQGDGHMSPFEHAAMAVDDTRYRGNFRGFVQWRKMLPGEAVFQR